MIGVKIWDIWVRLGHWAMAGLFGLSWWSAETGRMDMHVTSGLAMLALLLFRLAWGFFGSETARFADFLKSPVTAAIYLVQMRHQQRDVELGHNAAGGWMVLVLLALLLFQVGTGLMADDQVLTQGPLASRVPGWTSDLATSLHVLNFDFILAAVVLHVLAVLAYLLLKRHNLIAPMFTGRKLVPASMGPQAPRLAPAWRGTLFLVLAALIAWGISELGQ